MKLAVITCAVFPSEEDARRKLWIYLRSCEKFGVEPLLYGVGRTFPGYRIMKLDWQLEYLKEIQNDYSHVLYSDSWDCFFTASLSEIIRKYVTMGSPPVLYSAYLGLGNESHMESYAGCFDESKVYRFPNVGGYIAEIPAIIEAFEGMLRQPVQTGDDCFNLYWAIRDYGFRPSIDSNCEIFQVSDVNAIIPMGYKRVFNTVTNSTPCILHLSGGFSHPDSGKDEALKPWARALNII